MSLDRPRAWYEQHDQHASRRGVAHELGPLDGPSAGLRVAVEQALATLRPRARCILRASAVLGTEPSVAVAAKVADADPPAVLEAVAEAATAGLVVADGTDRFSFGHELIRSVVEATSGAGARLEAHARAAAAIDVTGAASPDRLGRRADHALAAAARSVDDARLAVTACEAAAGSMVESFAYGQADARLSAAVQLHESAVLGPPPGRLLVRWAQAAMRCGRMNEARQRFNRAVAVTQLEGDPVLHAEAALGLGGHGVMEHRSTLERARVLAQQRTALAGLPEAHKALRCRLRSRLVAEEVIDGASVEQAFHCVEEARDSGDWLALAEALALCHHVSLMPEHDEVRLTLAEELIQVAVEAGDGVLGLTGLWFRTIDLFHLGDTDARASLEDLRRRAGALGSRHISAGIGVIDVMLLTRAGRLAEAGAAAQRAHEQAVAAGEVNAFNYLAAQQLGIRWLQGRDAELLDVADTMVDSPDLGDAVFAFRASAAALTARTGQPDRARAMLGELAPDGLAALRQSSSWLVGLAAIVDLAATLEDADLARSAYDLLLPYACLPCLGGFAVLCLGSTEHALGVAASTFGDHGRAANHLERAIAENHRLSHRPMVAIAQADLAAALLGQEGPAAREAVTDLLEQAAAAADDMGMETRAAAWRDELAGLQATRPTTLVRRIGPRSGVIQRRGSRWEVALDDDRVKVGDLIGMSYLAELLTRPGQSISALTLASQGSIPRPPSHHELLDVEARTAYAARAQDLTADLAEAEDHNDLGRAERIRVELDALVDELESATGLLGRPRTFSDAGERARTAVRKALKRALDVIDDASPAIAEVLRSTVTTGATCTYIPDRRAPVVWSTCGDPEADEVGALVPSVAVTATATE